MQNNAVKYISGIIGFVVSIYIGQNFVKSNQISSNETLMHAASELNKTLPMMIDSDTQLFSTTGINKEFTYHYALINHDAKDVNLEAIKQLKPNMINMNCSSKETKLLLENDIAMTYKYFDKNRVHMLDIKILPSDCD